jgi:hypothetical protein
MVKKDVTLSENHVVGKFVEIENEKFYCIENYQEMPDFFISIVSDSNHWMFISSNGSLTAGRKNRDNSLFPYYTEDKIHDYRDLTGSKTLIRLEKNNTKFLWEPYTGESSRKFNIHRNLYKSIYGNKIIFEEINSDLELAFQYGWYNAEKFGFVKKTKITNLAKDPVKVDVLDGLRNILPPGFEYAFQNEYSNLLDAYKKSERIENTSLALYLLSSIPVDKAEPSEALKSNIVWSTGLREENRILISDKQIDNFRKGEILTNEIDVRASRGAYFINTKFELKSGETKDWYFLADLNKDTTDVANLIHFLKTDTDKKELIRSDIQKGTQNLIRIVAKADALQKSHEELSSARHFTNTLFNVMRGGVFANGYSISKDDFILYIKQTNKELFNNIQVWLKQLQPEINVQQLLNLAWETNNSDLIRIAYEYLPLTFSRRHGDPSRPWNQFSIENQNDDGTKKLDYQGNWRDIFQNWEALNLSYSGYIESSIAKFVNASTPDGYNPYRISRDGIDWEKPDPNDPWAYIGYWGDHQIIYLQKFLELSKAFHPGYIDNLLTDEIFVYANVPYRIKAFKDLIINPQDTVIFDHELNAKIENLAIKVGADGKLLRNSEGNIYYVNLSEKILATLLSKLSNFIPEAGIWLNTQRPEWNDANNALVGNGTSMVTLYYMRRFLLFWKEIFRNSNHKELLVSDEISTFLSSIWSTLNDHKDLLNSGFNDKERWNLAKDLGMTGSEYREKIYKSGFSGKKSSVTTEEISLFLSLSLKYIDQSISVNKREDGLYHAYNLISLGSDSIKIRHLYEMLEGQVAVLSSGFLSVKEALEVLDALKSSKLFRADQYSYLLYPNRELPRFIEKNNIPKKLVNESELLKTLINNNNSSIIKVDINGNYHFNSQFRNKNFLEKELESLDKLIYERLVKEEKSKILDIYEELFDHQSFTGRSGTFYGYEGLGSIYWHMVSKLLLATQEYYFRGLKEKADEVIIGNLKEHYYEIKAGIGLYKSPKLYGAFPTDAYSHTPENAGAKQPGLTGQVKEDFIARMREVGIQIEDGQIEFNPSLLNSNELLKENDKFEYLDNNGLTKFIDLKKGQLAYTFCQLPIIYTAGRNEKIVVHLANGEELNIAGHKLDTKISEEIFSRSKKVEKIEFFTTFVK